MPSTASIAQGFEVVIAPQGQFSQNPDLPWGMQAQDAARLLENNGGLLLVPSPGGTLIIAADPPIIGLENTYRSSRDQFISSFADGGFDANAYSALAEQIQLADTFRELQGTEGTIDLGAAYAADLTASFPGSKYNPESGNFDIYGVIELSPDVFLNAIPEQFDDLSTAENQEFRDLYERRNELTGEELERFQSLLDKGMGIPWVPRPNRPPPGGGGTQPIVASIFPYSCPDRVPEKTLPAACEYIVPIDPKSETCSCD
ncbi:hypothetical protein [Yoonia sp. F2084L]|uniref:hypothetical protein n=1 Tax=Yoonia sp. F2084L TaxID=2926419 RepID=UPI001FF16ED2|nr:hypothetical protein [Yoonia sp. F2084L]